MRQRFLRLASFAVLGLYFIAPTAAQSEDLTYTVSGIHVDVSAASATAALSIAIENGRTKAWDILYRRIAQQSDWGKQPKLQGADLDHLFRGYSARNEKRSTTRYVADVTYIFSPATVNRVMAKVSSTYAATALARRILVVPLSPGFDPDGSWTETFASPRFGGSAVPFSVPGSADKETLSKIKFDTAGWADVQKAASRIRATEAVLVLASVSGKTMDLQLKRVGAFEQPSVTTAEVPLQRNPTETYPAAADASLKAIEDMFKAKAAIGVGAKNRLVADLHITSLEQWATLQNAMTSVANVSGVQVDAMDIGLVRVTVSFMGTSDQLRDSWAPVGVSLSKDGDNWEIASAPPVKPSTVSSTP